MPYTVWLPTIIPSHPCPLKKHWNKPDLCFQKFDCSVRQSCEENENSFTKKSDNENGR